MKKRLIIYILLIVVGLSAQETIRVMTYNLLNYPGSTSATRNPYYHKIIDEIRPEILVVQELISQEGVDEFYDEVLKTIPMNYKAGIFVNGPDSDNEVYYDSTKFTLLSNTPITTALRDINQFALHHPHSNDTLVIFSVHLKSSSSSSDEALRLAEVDSLRKVTSYFPSSKYFLVCGDFNFYKSSEPAYNSLLDQSSIGYFIDPITTISGIWNNVSMAGCHTQSTRTASFGGGTSGGLDDRFDLILISQSLNDFGGITYVSDSYTNYGNDGNHYNLEIIDIPNSVVTDSIAEALYMASDHLPVIAEFVFENAMPVELVSFAGTVIEEGVLLNWQTAMEVNNYGFEVQKSEDRSQNSEWVKVGFVQGNGTTNSPKSYSFTDPLNLTYNPNLNHLDYRLKQIDNDGTVNYSKIVTVDISTITSVDDEIQYTFALEQNYPNPFNPSTTINFTIPTIGDAYHASQQTKLIVYDILGREIATLVNQKLQPGNHEVNFDASKLSSGMYFYKIDIGEDYNSIKKMLMIK